MLSVAEQTGTDIVCGRMIESRTPERSYKKLSVIEAQAPQCKALRGLDGYKWLLYGKIQPSPHAKLYRRSVLNGHPFPEKSYAEDLELNLKLFEKSRYVTAILEPFVEIYAVSEDGLMHKKYDDKKREGLHIIRGIYEKRAKTKDKSLKKAISAGVFMHSVGLIMNFNGQQELRKQYRLDYRELKRLIRRTCFSVAHDKNALPEQKRYALAACVSVRVMLKMMADANKKVS